MIGGFQVGPFQTNFQQEVLVVQPRGGTSRRKRVKYYHENLSPPAPEVFIAPPVPLQAAPQIIVPPTPLAEQLRGVTAARDRRRRRARIAALIAASMLDD